MQKTIFIALAGLVGTLLRYWLSGFVARQYGETFPWGTMVVNLIGCLVTGAVFFLTEERFLVSPTVRTVLLIGLLGGFTTFSSYGLQTFTLLRDGEFWTGDFECGYVEYSGSVYGVGRVRFGQSFVSSRGRISVTDLRRRE